MKALLTSSRTPASIIPALVEVFSRVEKDPQSRVNQVAVVISELKDPMQSSTQKGQAPISAGSDTFFDAAETLRPSPKKNAAAVQVTTCAISGYFNCSSWNTRQIVFIHPCLSRRTWRKCSAFGHLQQLLFFLLSTVRLHKLYVTYKCPPLWHEEKHPLFLILDPWVQINIPDLELVRTKSEVYRKYRWQQRA